MAKEVSEIFMNRNKDFRLLSQREKDKTIYMSI